MNIVDLFQIQGRFLRSTHLERDFSDASSLEGYVLTPNTKHAVSRIVTGISPRSSQRAWRITGDYGTGKSSFGLLLAHLFSRGGINLPSHLQAMADFESIGISQPRLLPVLVTGSREILSVALLRSLQRSLQQIFSRGRTPTVLHTLQAYLEGLPTQSISDESVLSLLSETSEYIREAGKGTGILIILDELGKFLEYAALRPESQDIYFLQRLAETAVRSTKSPIVVISLLHQGFSAYAEQLSQLSQKEWSKVASRYEEVLFNQPLDETVLLVANALNLQVNQLPSAIIDRTHQYMEETLTLGWFGLGLSDRTLISESPKLYPLHPTVVPVLVKLFSRFGQNERSLFSFLFSNEPFGLQEFANRPIGETDFYRLHNLYDYARATFGHRLSLQSYRNHWRYIDSIIESFPARDSINLQVLKTIGILNLLDAYPLVASREAIILASGIENENVTQSAITALHKGKHVLHYRGSAGGYCLWPHTSVNLEYVYAEASRLLEASGKVVDLIRNELQTQPLVARRHYIETGNLRHFEIRYTSVNNLHTDMIFDIEKADGLILIPLCETEHERQIALEFSTSHFLLDLPNILIAIPHPLNNLAPIIHELRRWEWISRNTPELNQDTYAAEEVSRQIVASRTILEERLQNFLGIRQPIGYSELQWFRQGQQLTIRAGPELLSYVSTICDEVYVLAPRITNELLNRRIISSAAAGARTRLIEQVLSYRDKPFLGMDESKNPPEMAMYLSVLKKGNLHKEINGVYAFVDLDTDNDPCQLRPVMRRIREILQAQPDARVGIVDLFRCLRCPPYGVRDGVIPLLLAVFIAMNQQNVAIYENKSFLPDVSSFDFLRLIKAPETFEIQFFQTTGVRTTILDLLSTIFVEQQEEVTNVSLLSVVRPLLNIVAKLPAYTQKTRRVSEQAQVVREVFVKSREPANLLFYELPLAFGLKPFVIEDDYSPDEVKMYITALHGAIEELRQAYPQLLHFIKASLIQDLDVPESHSNIVAYVGSRATQLLNFVRDPGLRGFCLRLGDFKLQQEDWLAAIGSFVCSKPPSKWNDLDVERFMQDFAGLCTRFKRTEAIGFSPDSTIEDNFAYRIAITRSDGAEVDQVSYFTSDEETKISQIEKGLIELVQKSKRLGLAAASRALWRLIEEE